MVMRAIRRALARHRRLPVERIKEFRHHRINYKGGEFRSMEQKLLRKLRSDKTLLAHLDIENHAYLLDVIVTEDAEIIVVYEMDQFLRHCSRNLGDPVEFNQLHKGGQFRYEFFCRELKVINRQRSVEMLLHYQPTLVLKAKYQYS